MAVLGLVAAFPLAGCDRSGGKAPPSEPVAAPGASEKPPATPRSRLRITSDPAGAEVRLDGSEVGTTPLELQDVEPGNRLIRLELKGHEPWEQSIYVSPGEMPPLEVPLETVAGSLVIRSVPPGAQVYLDGARRGATPLALEEVVAGSREIRLEMAGYTTHLTTLDVPPGGHLERDLELSIDPTRARALESLARAESLLESGKTYRAFREMQELTGSAEDQAALTSEDQRRMGYLQGRLGSGLPDVRFLLQFAGQDGPIEDGMGVPRESRPVAIPEGAGFVDFEIVIRRSATADYHVSLLQFKRHGRSAVRVVPHEALTSAESLLLEARKGQDPALEAHRAVDSTAARPDDVLYCLSISTTPPPERVLIGLAAEAGAEHREEPLVWARQVFELLEKSDWIGKGDVVLRSILVKLEER